MSEGRKRVGDISFGAFLFPQQIVFAEKAPVTTRLGRSTDVARIQVGQNVKGQFFGQQRDEIPLELRLDNGHHVLHLRGDGKT